MIALLAVIGIARAESITYELYELGDDGSRILLSKGVREYTIRDVVISESWLGARIRSAEIPVANGFSAGAAIFRETDLSGFGLSLKDRGTFLGELANGGFSWDWFNRESGLDYRKLQGPGRVRVTLVPSSQFQEIASVEVLEDITLRVNNRPWFFFRKLDTHHLVIAKGSVLRFAP